MVQAVHLFDELTALITTGPQQMLPYIAARIQILTNLLGNIQQQPLIPQPPIVNPQPPIVNPEPPLPRQQQPSPGSQ
jgi:hypothetical protein